MHRGHRSLELLEGRWIRRAANDFPCEQPRHVCCLEQAFRRLQATQRIADFGEPALDRRNRRSLDAGAAAVGGALPEPAQFTLQRLDRAARHRLLQRPTDLCEFCEQPSADLLEGARLLGPANLGARGDRAEGPFGRRDRRDGPHDPPRGEVRRRPDASRHRHPEDPGRGPPSDCRDQGWPFHPRPLRLATEYPISLPHPHVGQGAAKPRRLCEAGKRR